jgi:hypothetical protein
VRRKLPGEVLERVVARARCTAGGLGVGRARDGLGKLPEGEREAVVLVRAGIERRARRHDRRAGTGKVAGDGDRAGEPGVAGAHGPGPRGDARNDRRGRQVDEQVAAIAQDDRRREAQPLLLGDADGGLPCPLAQRRPGRAGHARAQPNPGSGLR